MSYFWKSSARIAMGRMAGAASISRGAMLDAKGVFSPIADGREKNGIRMPAWREVLTDKQIWQATATFCRSASQATKPRISKLPRHCRNQSCRSASELGERSLLGTFQKCPAKLTMSVDGGKADLALGCAEV